MQLTLAPRAAAPATRPAARTAVIVRASAEQPTSRRSALAAGFAGE
jgi:hypothetical protein